MLKFGILGAGTWGTALGNMLANMGYEVSIWSPVEEEINSLSKNYTHIHLKGCEINKSITFTLDIEKCLKSSDFIIFATPSVFVRSTANKIKPFVNNKQIIISVAKGVEPKTMMTMCEIIKDVLGQDFKAVALSGPTHAEEVAIGLPTLIVSACEDKETAEYVRNTINNQVLRVYSNTDIKGVEIAGALKNIIALACGMSEGLGFGDNAKAAIITRGLSEITRLGTAMGCDPNTFFGLTGIGDIVVTATSNFSRNHNAGVLLGQGKTVEEIKKGLRLGKGVSLEETLKQIGMVVEGINALIAAKELSNKYDVEMPIVNTVYSAVYEGVDIKEAVKQLFARSLKEEKVC